MAMQKMQSIWTKDRHHNRERHIGSISTKYASDYKTVKIELISNRNSVKFNHEDLRKIEFEIREILENNNLIVGGNKRNYISKKQ